MDFSDALRAMKGGKVVTREVWQGKATMHAKEGALVFSGPQGAFVLPSRPTRDDVFAEDWMVASEAPAQPQTIRS